MLVAIRFVRQVSMVSLALLTAAAGCSSASTGPDTQAGDGRVYPLPSSGWKSGGASLLALDTGVFQAALTRLGACAWLGNPASDQKTNVSFLWPVGYRVRFSPTELINAEGQIVAHAGMPVSVAGGYTPRPARNRCTARGMQTWSVQSKPFESRRT